MRDILSPLSGIRGPFNTRRFDPSLLFRLSEPGAWYDPNDLTTVFTDTAGTTPATVGDAVALMLDKSKGAGYSGGAFTGLGSELVTNGGFDSDVSGWAEALGGGATFTWSSGEGLLTTGSSGGRAYQVFSTVVGRTYRLNISARNITATLSGYRITTDATGGTTGQITAETSLSGSWTKSVLFVATASSTTIAFLIATSGGLTAAVDNISVRELPGNHATQSTLGNRPILSREPATGRRNLLTYTEQFDNAAWGLDNSGAANPVVTANVAVAPDGTTTADRIQLDKTGGTFSRIQQVRSGLPSAIYTFSVWMRKNGSGTSNVGIRVDGIGVNCAVTETWQRFSVSLAVAGTIGNSQILLFDSIAGNDETADIFAWGAQLEAASTATAYQRVVTARDVTEAGVADRYYLFFDGSDDWLVTPTITPGTDKVQVFAGVRKLSDAAEGIVAETSASVLSSQGSFFLMAPSNVAASYAWAARSVNLLARLNATGFTAPRTSVLTGISDVAANSRLLRVDGVQQVSASDAMGGGNFLAHPLYIGRRGGTTLPFNGHLYGLIVRFGDNLGAATIASTEAYMNRRAGAY